MDCDNESYEQLFMLLLLWKSYFRVMARERVAFHLMHTPPTPTPLHM